MSDIPFPLPPLNEQKRIADKVERLLDKTNLAKQLIEEAKETFELRRAAILDKAFRGELTKKWREERNQTSKKIEDDLNKNIPMGWKLVQMGSLAADEKYSLAIGPFGSNLKVTDYQDEGVPLIFVRNIRSSDYDLEKKYVSEKKADELKAHAVTCGDILITKMGDPPGDSDLCPEHVERAIITADCIKLKVNTNIAFNKYIMYAIRSPFVRTQITQASKGVAQQKISLQIFKEVQVLLPPLEEQILIVQKLERLMNREQEILSNLVSVEKLMKKTESSVLSKAFCGELGTNSLEEDSSIDVLV